MTLRAIARQTIAEAIRMHIAVGFTVLIALIVLGMPFAVRGDDTITGAVQNYMSWSLGLVMFLLSLLTIFMAKSLSDELVGRQIFLMMTKPVARWQYIVGKWLGIATLNVGLLLAACIGVYGMVRLLAARPAHPSGLVQRAVSVLDRLMPARRTDVPGDYDRLWSEVLVARHHSPVKVPLDEIHRMANQRLNEKKENGDYEGLKDFDPQKELDLLSSQFEDSWRTVVPGDARQFDFEGVVCDRSRRLEADLAGDSFARGAARYSEIMRKDQQIVRRLEVEVAQAKARELVTVLINNNRAGTISTDESGNGRLVVTNAGGQPWPDELPEIAEDLYVEAGPCGGFFRSTNNLQVRYKATVVNYSKDETLRALWQFGHPERNTPIYHRARADVIDRYHNIPVPTDAVATDEKSTLTAAFVNQNPFGPTYPNIVQFPKEAELEALFNVGTFLGNFSRWFALAACRLMFLAAVALLAVSIFSYPVAFLAFLTVLILAWARAFINEAFEFLNVNEGSAVLRVVVQAVQYALRALFLLVPDFDRYNGTELLVEGRNITLMWVFQGLGVLVVVQTAIVMLLTCLCFWRREVAEASV